MAKRTVKKAMASTSEVRAMFDKAIADTTDPDVRAKRELLREYFTNPEFRSAMAGFVREQVQAK